MRRPVAVRLDIRPRLKLPPEPRAVVRRRWRMPPLALPAAGYWLAMAGLTYFFAHLGPHPLDAAEAHELAAPRNEPSPAMPEPQTQPNDVAPAPPPVAEVASAVEPAPVVDSVASAPSQEHEHEHADNRKAGRREDFGGSGRDERRRDEKETVAQEPAPAAAARAPERPVAMSFPEFTDSSRAPRRERAADGPRIDSLFERADQRPSREAPTEPAPPPETTPAAPVAVSSCEAAIARNNEQMTIGGPRGAPDISREAYAGILQNGRYLASCSIPERSVFEICAAVKNGRAVGITVVSNPASPALNACVRQAVARLKFPSNERLDVTHTRFDRAR